jgi:cytochrome P450
MELPDLHYLFYAKAGGALLALYISYRLIRSITSRILTRATNSRLSKQYSCQPVKQFKTWDPLFGLDLFYAFIQETKTNSTLEGTRSRFARMSSNTITFPLFAAKIIATCEPENVKTTLSTKFDDWGLEALRAEAVPFVGRGIFTTDGAAWQHSRNLLKPMFTRSQLADVSVFETHVDRLISHIPHDSTTIDLQPLFFQLTLDITTHVMLGESTDLQITSTNTAASDFAAAFQRCLNYFGTDPGIEIFGLKWLSAKRRQFKSDCQFLHAHIDKYIRKAYDETSNPLFVPKSPGTDPNRNILLYDLVGQEVSRETIRSEILNTILAGRDTTASMLSDLWFELSKHPEVFKALRHEVNTHCPSSTEITFELLKNLPYLRAVLNECLRIHPVVPENARLAKTPTTLPTGGGPSGIDPVFVPKGTLLLYSVYSMHRRKDLWGENADEFVPERWLDTDTQKGARPGWSFLPFNGGPRVCIGQQFALLMVSYVTVRIMQGIKDGGLESRDQEPWKENLTITCTGKGGCKVGITGKEKR